jgi:murein DD-endopeptidase MepM/ murein hydrolase activator NlpD
MRRPISPIANPSAAYRVLTPSLLVLAAVALSACGTTSQYAPRDGYQAPGAREMPRPNFPITQAAPQGETLADAPPPVATAPGAAAEDAPRAAPSGAVTAQPLPAPVSSQALPPISSPAPAAYAPAPAPTMRTTTQTVTSVSGRVVDVTGKRETYKVKKGDTLTAIAKKMDISQADLIEVNDLKKPYVLHPGDVLKGPQTRAKAYVVGQGDTLSAIARRFSVTAASLAAANDLRTTASIRSGQRLELPAGYKDTGPVRRTVTVSVPVPDAPAATTFAAAAPPPPPPPVVRPAPPPASTSTTTTTTLASVPPAARPVTTTTTTTTAPPRPGAAPVTTTTTVIRPAAPTPPPATASAGTAAALPVATAALSDTEIAAAGRGRFTWPAQGTVISAFGPKGTGQRNDGLNLRVAAGEPVKAAAAGEVVYAGDQVPGFGNLVLVKHDGGWVTAYAHLSRADVRMRQTVAQGQQIGQAGSTGGVAEPQLHFEVRYAPSAKDKAIPIDPALVLPR